MSNETLTIRANNLELKLRQKLLTVFLQYTICFKELRRCRSQNFDWQAMSQCSVGVSKCIPLHQ